MVRLESCRQISRSAGFASDAAGNRAGRTDWHAPSHRARPFENSTEGHVSPLGRAKLTAAHIGQFVPLDFREEPRLVEVTLGNWDGLNHYEIDMEYPGML